MGAMYPRASVVGSKPLKMVLLAAGALAVAVPSLAHASPISIPGAEYDNKVVAGSGYDQGGSQEVYSPTPGLNLSGTVYFPFGSFSWSAETVNDYGTPRVSATASADSIVDAYAYSKLIYYIAFAGAAGSISVPVQASGATSNTPGFSNASAQLIVSGYSPDQGVVINEQEGFAGVDVPFSINQSYTLQANEIYRVMLIASASAGSGYANSASAWVDPYFGTPDGYTFLRSESIGNAPPNTTPIPAALPLFASGLGGFAYLARRRKRKLASAA